MKINTFTFFPCLMAGFLLVTGCQKSASISTATAVVVASGAASNTASEQTRSSGAASGDKKQDSPATPVFDFTSVPESTVEVPPFPYLETPKQLNSAFLTEEKSTMDELYVILGKSLHRIEGRIHRRQFDFRDAEMTAAEIRRNYENALKSAGAVKVSATDPKDEEFVGKHGGDSWALQRKLRYPSRSLSYDAYLIRKGKAHHWIVLMLDDTHAALVSAEEIPFVQTIGYVGTAGKTVHVTATGAPAMAPTPVDIDKIAVSQLPLPEFPYIAPPATLDKTFDSVTTAAFDTVQFIVDKQLKAIDGRVLERTFSLKNANMSRMSLQRNYEAAVAGLGAVKVNSVSASDPALKAAHVELDKRLRMPTATMDYDSYVIRTADKRVWIALMLNDDTMKIVVVDEKAFVQSIALVTSATMQKELTSKGRIALYVNFDTDKATLRADGKPTVDQITSLMKSDAGLKLAIEGHTDNAGDAKHNKALSQRRAEAVVAALVSAGVDKGRLSASGIGDASPIADNKDEAGRAKNRRVELVKK